MSLTAETAEDAETYGNVPPHSDRTGAEALSTRIVFVVRALARPKAAEALTTNLCILETRSVCVARRPSR